MKRTEITSRANRVAKLLRERILGSHDPLPGDDGSGNPVAVTKMTPPSGGGYGPDGVMFENGKVLFCVHGHRQNINGVVGGFNLYSINAAHTLADFGIISQEDVDAFREWYEITNQRQTARDDLAQLRRDAAERGFELLKKNSSSPARSAQRRGKNLKPQVFVDRY